MGLLAATALLAARWQQWRLPDPRAPDRAR